MSTEDIYLDIELADGVIRAAGVEVVTFHSEVVYRWAVTFVRNLLRAQSTVRRLVLLTRSDMVVCVT